MNILLAEDDIDMQKIIRLYLERDGYTVFTANNGKDAVVLLQEYQIDLIIADWMMPLMNGLQLCTYVQKNVPNCKILLLTAKSTTADEITGLTCGADDFIRKPFEIQILLLRIRKLLGYISVMVCGDIRLDSNRHCVYKNDEQLNLTSKEYQLLEILMRNKGYAVSRISLLEKVWGADYDGDERTLDTHIRRLRQKVGKTTISTCIGFGYRMDE